MSDESPGLLRTMLRQSVELVVVVAGLQALWLMAVPAAVWMRREGVVWALVMGLVGGPLGALLQQRLRRRLRLLSIGYAADEALRGRSAATDLEAEAAFWVAHLSEYLVSTAAPSLAGALAALVLVLVMFARVLGWGWVLVATLILSLVGALGIASTRWLSPLFAGAFDARQRVALWVAVAVHGGHELTSRSARDALSERLQRAVLRWCQRDERSEIMRAVVRVALLAFAAILLVIVLQCASLDLRTLVVTLLDGRRGWGTAALLVASVPVVVSALRWSSDYVVAYTELTRHLRIDRPREDRTLAQTRLLSPPSTLRLESLVGGYKDHAVIRSVSLVIPLDGIVGIFAANGAGKSTLARMLTGLQRPMDGALWIDEVRAHEVDGEDVAFVPQEPVLMDGLSVRESVHLVVPEVSEEAMREMLTSLGFVQGIDTLITTLSQGERRRVGLARALLKRPKLLVMDEPDTALDHRGRTLLAEALIEARKHSAIVLVSHREELVALCSSIVRIDDGRLSYEQIAK
ncbi:MAG: ABC transporter ATP-binding protein [Deltaproteobacteria bacterium]|nr:ABC transporter ATP-binding protein [Deltaproteobacteria bacterium]